MYIDSHKHEDVVAYQKAFVVRCTKYEKYMVHFDNDGNEQTITQGFKVEQCGWFHLILVTHDDSLWNINTRICGMHLEMHPFQNKRGKESH